MFNFTPLVTLAQSHEDAISAVTSRLETNGLKVVRSFDLQSACAFSGDSANQFCPHHPQEVCDCQLVILLVYAGGGQPLTLIAHSNDGLTQMGLGSFPNGQPNPALETRIIDLLAGVRKQKATIRSLDAAKQKTGQSRFQA